LQPLLAVFLCPLRPRLKELAEQADNQRVLISEAAFAAIPFLLWLWLGLCSMR